MKMFWKTFILAICFIVPTMFFLTACDGETKAAKVSSFSVELANTAYTLIDDKITVTYGEDYRFSVSDFSVTAVFDDETSRVLASSELNDLGFTFESNIPDSAKTPVGVYEISIKHKDVEASKTISLAVEKATINYRENDIAWSMSELAYDGTEKAVTITNLPDTLKVVYQNNAKTNVGEYTATATVDVKDGDNYIFEEITVEHTWEIKIINYAITYENTCGLENNNQTTYTVLSETITLKSLTGRNHYTFDGWYYNNEKITIIPKGFTGGNITLEAKWTPIIYTITYQDTKDAVNTNPKTYTIEDGTITLAPLANRVDYTFLRWERVYDELYKVDILPTTTISAADNKGNIILKAVWDKKTEYDCFEYTVSKDGTKATITGLKDKSSTNITIPSGVVAIGNNVFKNCTTLTTVNFEDGTNALTIGDYAFSGCTSLSSITIPARVTEIGNYAFERSGLRKMNFSKNGNLTTLGNSVFHDCAGLNEFTIPDSVVSMGMDVFSSCIYLTKIVFGKGMTVIGESVYGGSSVLREIEFKGEIISFHKDAFNHVATKNITLTLNMNQKNLEQEAFRNNNGGTDYSDDYRAESRYYRVVSTTTAFCGYTFSKICLSCDATEMTAEEFSSRLESGSSGVFTNLKFILPARADNYFSAIAAFVAKYAEGTVTLTIDGATSIPAGAFYTDGVGYQLKEVIIGDSIANIGNEAFYYCMNLQKVTFGKGLTFLGELAFSECRELTDIVIPDSVISIGMGCFNNCTKLESIKLSSSITELSWGLFGGCELLKSIIIPDGVTLINNQALIGCKMLESIVIPNSVATISYDATYNCNALTTVYYIGTESDWQSIFIDGYNDSLNTATIYYYSEARPSGTGNHWHYVSGVPTAWQ